jgi:hypothetical protein
MNRRRRAAKFGGGLGLLALAVLGFRAAGPMRADAPAAGKEVVVGDADLRVARANRLLIENRLTASDGRPVQLPAGVIHLDRALALGPKHSGRTLQGAGPQTVLRNSHYEATYPLNSTLCLVSWEGLGYADGLAGPARPGVLTLAGGAAAGNFRAGSVCYAWQWDGYVKPGGQLRSRLVVTAADPKTGEVRYAGDTPDPRALHAKWMDSRPLTDVREGSPSVTLENAADAKLYAVGRWVFVTDGPSIANEARGEYRRVTGVDGASVRLDRPLRQSYAAAALVRVRPVEDVTLRDLTLAQPVNGSAQALASARTVGLRLERVRVGLPGERTTEVAIGACAYTTLRDCEFHASLALNTAHDLTAAGGRYLGFTGEEQCQDVTIRDCLIAPAGRPVHGVKFHLDSERVSVLDCRIEGAGAAHPAGGAVSPLDLRGRECRVHNCRVVNSVVVPGFSASYLGGDGLRVEGLDSDLAVNVTSGRGVRLNGSQAGGWFLAPGTSGRMDACGPAPDPPPAGWRVDGREPPKGR